MNTLEVKYDRPFEHFKEPISYQKFENCMKRNIPCSFGKWISYGWNSRTSWVLDDGQPNFDFLEENYGSFSASVTKFSSNNDFDCISQTISQFISYWKSIILERAPSNNHKFESFPVADYHTLPHYLKDWHFAMNTDPSSVYFVPDIFADDWLNRFWRARGDIDDDYIFSYFGPTGSFTPFHADVFRSYSWSINVCGRKKWLILYPGEESKLDCNSLNIEEQCTSLGLKYEVVIQNEGEGIFVPSGWWHQVLNTADTISINHNWANFHCVPRMWKYLTSELELVEEEISDCRHLMTDLEWDKQCQVVLRANIGISFMEFVEFVLFNLNIHSQDEYKKFISEIDKKQNEDILSKLTKTHYDYEAYNKIHEMFYSNRDIVEFLKAIITEIKSVEH